MDHFYCIFQQGAIIQIWQSKNCPLPFKAYLEIIYLNKLFNNFCHFSTESIHVGYHTNYLNQRILGGSNLGKSTVNFGILNNIKHINGFQETSANLFRVKDQLLSFNGFAGPYIYGPDKEVFVNLLRAQKSGNDLSTKAV